MMKLFAPLLGLAALIAIDLSYAATPAAALGGCGPNRHRSSVTGRCIWGGQNQGWCVRHTGYRAVRMPNGRMVCVRR
ncbi:MULTISPECIES: hypothetical protein [unclassified Hyphomicrobium]|uniref:hypothetical protein n=1 Tax=unclassified Hyphomicrobium TaxID=2619925 RepID=UPI000213D68D|nr:MULTISPECIES: hypothetical protein [unclassified Hyphomicrobium]CCB68128.1 conserved exported protein of unknown function [Hyphomicrobium sp. MC1]